MTCIEIYQKLDTFATGGLSSEDTRHVEHHLTGCAACRERVDRLLALTGTLRRCLRHDRAPLDLWARIEAKLPPAAEPGPIRRALGFWQQRTQTMVLAASLALLLGVGGSVPWWSSPRDQAVVIHPIHDFTTYRASGRALDIESSDPAVIRAWFDEKLAFELPPVKSRIAGFDLVGGRLCWFLDRRVGALAYMRNGHTISVYVMADGGLALPKATFQPQLAISRSFHQVDDVSNMIWQHDGLVYTVVSDLKAADLSIFLAALARDERRRADAGFHGIERPWARPPLSPIPNPRPTLAEALAVTMLSKGS